MNPEYKPVKIFGCPFRAYGNQVYYHAGRDEYAIERGHEVLVALNERETRVLKHTLAWWEDELDEEDRLDDDGKHFERD